MSTLTKEWLQQTIAELEEERDSVPGAVNEDAAMALAAMKLALESLEAEPVAFRSKLKPPSAIGSGNWDYTDHRQPDAFELESCVIERLFTEPPALLAVPAGYRLQPISEYDAMCSAMLQGAEPVKSGLTLREGLAAIRNSGIAIDAGKIQAERDALNGPVIPDGWVLVPVEPTEDMIVNGFESEPDESFSDEKEWEAYDAMSGCQQAAHRAKLCWAAMIKAAPKLE